MIEKIENKCIKLAIIGLGYVGLPLEVEFGKKYPTVGYDIKESRLELLRKNIDSTMETDTENLKSAKHLSFTNNSEDLKDCDIFIITVPTPIDAYSRPDLSALLKASETVGRVMKNGAIVVYESTVYPGCTEEDCVPVLEQASGKKFNKDFYCGYSPERVNPGDKVHRLTEITKLISGSTTETVKILDKLYNSILNKGTHIASSIKVAEAAKVIENSQRDLNIAFVNELAKIFKKIGIDTNEVLDAAATKWNFLNFRPGLVGGHCIGVDPFYLTHKAQSLGYLPEVILAGRRINDSMGKYVAVETVKLMIKKEISVSKAKVLVLGITFKENCPDIRNSRVIDVVDGLKDFGCDVDVLDPWAKSEEVEAEYGITSYNNCSSINLNHYTAFVIAVAHSEFKKINFESTNRKNNVIFDVKGLLPHSTVDARL